MIIQTFFNHAQFFTSPKGGGTPISSNPRSEMGGKRMRYLLHTGRKILKTINFDFKNLGNVICHAKFELVKTNQLNKNLLIAVSV